VTLKSLVTGVAAAAVVGGAAAGVTFVASPAVSHAQPCADAGQLTAVINGLAAPGVGFHSGKSDLVEGGVGIVEGRTADRLLKNAYESGALPVQFNVGPPVCNPDGSTTATVSAGGRSQAVTFVPGGRFGWQLSRGSATAVLSALS
jgi:hypothetical protein